MFAAEWFSTLFVYNFPLEVVFRIWDSLFLEQRTYIFRFAIAIMKLSKGKSLKRKKEKKADEKDVQMRSWRVIVWRTLWC